MIDVDALRKEYADKLVKTKSHDEAFTKAVWLAYKEGIKDGRAEMRSSVYGLPPLTHRIPCGHQNTSTEQFGDTVTEIKCKDCGMVIYDIRKALMIGYGYPPDGKGFSDE